MRTLTAVSRPAQQPCTTIEGVTVSFVGRLSQLTHEGAARVVRELGGYPQEQHTRNGGGVMVVGSFKPDSPKPQRLAIAETDPRVTVIEEADFMAMIPAEVLARHHRGAAAPPSPDLSRFRAQIAAAAEAYTLRCVQRFIADDLPGQKTIEIDNPRDPAFCRLGRLLAEVVFSVSKDSPAMAETREMLAGHNLKMVVGSPARVAAGHEHTALRFRVLDKRRFLLDAHKFITAGKA